MLNLITFKYNYKHKYNIKYKRIIKVYFHVFLQVLFLFYLQAFPKHLLFLTLVVEGSITSSTYPLAAAIYGFENFPCIRQSFVFLLATGSAAVVISFLKIIFAAPSGTHYCYFSSGPCKYHICT